MTKRQLKFLKAMKRYSPAKHKQGYVCGSARISPKRFKGLLIRGVVEPGSHPRGIAGTVSWKLTKLGVETLELRG